MTCVEITAGTASVTVIAKFSASSARRALPSALQSLQSGE
jgi:hypothetical protein